MIITWFGQSCFKFQGETTALVTDPFDANCGLKVPRLNADIVTMSHDHHDHNNIEAVKPVGEKIFIIKQPGEYEVNGVFVYGFSSFHDQASGVERGANTIYRFEFDGMTITHLGDLGHLLDDELAAKLEGTDILLIPVGGKFTIDAKQASQVISQLEPRIVIPMHYQIPGLKTSEVIDSVEKFTKEVGASGTEVLDKFKISKKDLPQEDVRFVILSA